MHRRVYAEVHCRGKPAKLARIRPAAVDPEGRDEEGSIQCEICRRKAQRVPPAVSMLHNAGDDVPVPQKAHGLFHPALFQKPAKIG